MKSGSFHCLLSPHPSAISSFLDSFMQQIFNEGLHFQGGAYRREQNKKHCPQGFYILAGGDRQINTTNKYTTVDP